MSPPLRPVLRPTAPIRQQVDVSLAGGARPAQGGPEGRAWPCACGGAVRFSGAALTAYAAGDGEVLVTVEQAAHNHSARHAAWSERSLWRYDAYERRRDLEET